MNSLKFSSGLGSKLALRLKLTLSLNVHGRYLGLGLTVTLTKRNRKTKFSPCECLPEFGERSEEKFLGDLLAEYEFADSPVLAANGSSAVKMRIE